MALGLIATLKVREGKEEQFEAIFREFELEVMNTEPGNQLYRLFKSRTEPNTYLAMEIYDDDAAHQAHRAAEHSKAAVAKFGRTLVGPPDLVFYDSIATDF